jgi:hypothetical protein
MNSYDQTQANAVLRPCPSCQQIKYFTHPGKCGRCLGIVGIGKVTEGCAPVHPDVEASRFPTAPTVGVNR